MFIIIIIIINIVSSSEEFKPRKIVSSHWQICIYLFTFLSLRSIWLYKRLFGLYPLGHFFFALHDLINLSRWGGRPLCGPNTSWGF